MRAESEGENECDNGSERGRGVPMDRNDGDGVSESKRE